jgi:hypothetical protein
MGINQSNRRTIINANGNDLPHPIQQKEEDLSYLGTVSVKLSWLLANNRLPQEQQSDLIVTGKSALFHGTGVPLPCVVEGRKILR